jgi:group I intron endonuclease
MTGIIYIARNSITGKAYVGQTIHKLSDRKKSHKFNSKVRQGRFYTAIRKYGFDVFGWAILEECEIKDLDQREIYWITVLDTAVTGYNLSPGGQIRHGHSEETKEKLRRAGLRRGMPALAFERAIAVNRGGHRSEETRAKQREAALGRKWTPEMKEYIRRKRWGVA